mgnify:CR=1 FL=1
MPKWSKDEKSILGFSSPLNTLRVTNHSGHSVDTVTQGHSHDEAQSIIAATAKVQD